MDSWAANDFLTSSDIQTVDTHHNTEDLIDNSHHIEIKTEPVHTNEYDVNINRDIRFKPHMESLVDIPLTWPVEVKEEPMESLQTLCVVDTEDRKETIRSSSDVQQDMCDSPHKCATHGGENSINSKIHNDSITCKRSESPLIDIKQEFDIEMIYRTENTQIPVDIKEETYLTDIKQESDIEKIYGTESTQRPYNINEETHLTDIKQESYIGKICRTESTQKPYNINGETYLTDIKQESYNENISGTESTLNPVDIMEKLDDSPQPSATQCNDTAKEKSIDIMQPGNIQAHDARLQSSSEVMILVTDKHGNKSIQKLRVTSSIGSGKTESCEAPLDGSFKELDKQDISNIDVNCLQENNSVNNSTATRQSNQVSCRICNKKVHKRGMIRHEATHGKRLQCSQCPAKFSDKWNLKDHEIRHAEPFICDSCGKRFISRSGLYRHMKDHGSERRPYECEICKERFSIKVHLEGHRNSKHLSHKPFKCNFCDKTFSYKSSISRHSNECQGIATFHCPECPTVVKSKRSLDQHLKGKHGKESYRCSCGKSFTWTRSFNRHLKSCSKQ